MMTAFAARPVGGRAAFTLNPAQMAQRFFPSPAPAGRRITAGFSHIQRIDKAASIDVWFPEALRAKLEALLARGQALAPDAFPAQWAALRQFELLQEGGNYKIYDLDAAHLTRSMVHMARDMRAGGYRVTVASIGGYGDDADDDDLRILDLRLQDRLSQLIHMLYMEEESARKNEKLHQALSSGDWDVRKALPHIGALLGARDLFRPIRLQQPLKPADIKHRLARQFFDALSLLPAQHIVHDTAIGLQLPEAINENEWIYVAPGDETLAAMNSLLNSLFRGFGKTTSQHLRGTGDRLTPGSEAFYRGLAGYAL